MTWGNQSRGIKAQSIGGGGGDGGTGIIGTGTDIDLITLLSQVGLAKDRSLAIRRMEIALEEMIVEGIKTTIPFHRLALASEKFRSGDLSTRFVEELLRDRAAATPGAPAPR